MLATQGLGTAIPLDPTKHLVRTGIYAYVANPMQLSAALSWIVLGLFLRNIWVASAAVMAWIFVEGMVRWHHRNDLMQRFTEGWPEYRRHVPEWLPRWRPWCPGTACLTIDPARPLHRLVAGILTTTKAVGLNAQHGEAARYRNSIDVRSYSGSSALWIALTHGNLLTALLGHVLLLATLLLARPSVQSVVHDSAT